VGLLQQEFALVGTGRTVHLLEKPV